MRRSGGRRRSAERRELASRHRFPREILVVLVVAASLLLFHWDTTGGPGSAANPAAHQTNTP